MISSRPPLLLHICCAPDEAWVVQTLGEHYELTCFFCNPNIYPETEYEIRLSEARRVATHFRVPFFADVFDPASWEREIGGAESTPEGGERCRRCFLLRLRRTARFCKEIDLCAFTTVMSVSPHKNVTLLNETGLIAATEYGVRFEPFDFKKKDGFRKSILLSKDLGIYRQDYCGCRLSKAEREVRMQVRRDARRSA